GAGSSRGAGGEDGGVAPAAGLFAGALAGAGERDNCTASGGGSGTGGNRKTRIWFCRHSRQPDRSFARSLLHDHGAAIFPALGRRSAAACICRDPATLFGKAADRGDRKRDRASHDALSSLVTLMNAIVGAATGLAMWAFGFADPILWGTAAFLLNYIPILGLLTGVIMFFAVGILTFESPWSALLPAGIYLLIHIAEGE